MGKRAKWRRRFRGEQDTSQVDIHQELEAIREVVEEKGLDIEIPEFDELTPHVSDANVDRFNNLVTQLEREAEFEGDAIKIPYGSDWKMVDLPFRWNQAVEHLSNYTPVSKGIDIPMPEGSFLFNFGSVASHKGVMNIAIDQDYKNFPLRYLDGSTDGEAQVSATVFSKYKHPEHKTNGDITDNGEATLDNPAIKNSYVYCGAKGVYMSVTVYDTPRLAKYDVYVLNNSAIAGEQSYKVGGVRVGEMVAASSEPYKCDTQARVRYCNFKLNNKYKREDSAISALLFVRVK